MDSRCTVPKRWQQEATAQQPAADSEKRETDRRRGARIMQQNCTRRERKRGEGQASEWRQCKRGKRERRARREEAQYKGGAKSGEREREQRDRRMKEPHTSRDTRTPDRQRAGHS